MRDQTLLVFAAWTDGPAGAANSQRALFASTVELGTANATGDAFRVGKKGTKSA
jgi:hypothetical protein